MYPKGSCVCMPFGCAKTLCGVCCGFDPKKCGKESMVGSDTPLAPTFWKFACGKGGGGEFVKWTPLLLFGDMVLNGG